MGGYLAYTEYKDSGIEWLGEIPEHWQIKKIKYLKAPQKNSFVDGPFGSNLKSVHFVNDGDVFVIESEFATRGKIVESELKQITEEHFSTIKRSEAKGGDIIIAKIGAYFGLNNILPAMSKPAVVSGNSLKLSINQEISNIRFIHFLLLYLKNSGAIDLLASITAQPALSLGEMNGLSCCFPPLSEQQQIAAFLDYKTAQIDALIANKEALLEKLAEKRTALISQAVTKGLDPTVPMKDSGIEWLGKIPEHWEIKRQRFLCEMTGGSTPSKNNPDFWDGDIPWISPKDMKRPRLNGSIDRLSQKALEQTSIHLHASGKVLIVVRGMILAHTFPVAVNDVSVTVNQDMKVLNTTLNPEYLAILLRGISSLVLSIVEESAHGTKVLRTDLFKNIFIPEPPQLEQKNIVKYVKDVTDETDKMIRFVTTAVKRLKEYRTALITNAVTGKIDVRDIKLSQPNSSEAA